VRTTGSSHGYRGVPVLVFGPVEKKREDSRGDEAAVEQGAANYHQLAVRSHRCSPGRYWDRMHGNLAVIGDGLDSENPDVVAAQPAPERD
jgi:hypothetical protein